MTLTDGLAWSARAAAAVCGGAAVPCDVARPCGAGGGGAADWPEFERREVCAHTRTDPKTQAAVSSRDVLLGGLRKSRMDIQSVACWEKARREAREKEIDS